MPGTLDGPIIHVLDEKEANRIHNKGYPGWPVSGGGLDLALLEAAFLMDERDFQIDGIDTLIDLFHHAGDHIRDFEVCYLVYRELKLRGFIVKLDEVHYDPASKGVESGSFRLLPRGSGPSVPATLNVLPASERSPFHMESFIDFCTLSTTHKVEPVLGVVDEDGDITFYSLRVVTPVGDCKEMEDNITLEGVLVHNRVLVPLDDTTRDLHINGFYGRIMGSVLHLSLTEARYLMECGTLHLEGTNIEDLDSWSRSLQSDFLSGYTAYRYLREKGLRVKTGFKFGTHFRAYSSHQDHSHADHLVQVYQDDAVINWQEVSRGIRVAHGVKKKMLLSTTLLGEKGQFLEMTWIRP